MFSFAPIRWASVPGLYSVSLWILDEKYEVWHEIDYGSICNIQRTLKTWKADMPSAKFKVFRNN